MYVDAQSLEEECGWFPCQFLHASHQFGLYAVLKRGMVTKQADWYFALGHAIIEDAI
jgi:hypothetical protein